MGQLVRRTISGEYIPADFCVPQSSLSGAGAYSWLVSRPSLPSRFLGQQWQISPNLLWMGIGFLALSMFFGEAKRRGKAGNARSEGRKKRLVGCEKSWPGWRPLKWERFRPRRLFKYPSPSPNSRSLFLNLLFHPSSSEFPEPVFRTTVTASPPLDIIYGLLWVLLVLLGLVVFSNR